VAKAAGGAAGSGLNSFLESSGIKDMLKKFGLYILIFFAVVLGGFLIYMFV
jgi:preprotein translocase subunit SecG